MWFYPSWMCASLSSFSPSPNILQFPMVVGAKITHLGSCTQVSEYKPSGKSTIFSSQIQSFCSVNYTVSCVPVAKVNHIIPCLSIRWKSKSFFFIKCLILILSWSLIVTTLGKLILLLLKVTVTSSKSISRVFPI